MYQFNASTYSVSEEALLTASAEVKERVENWVREGMERGIVRPKDMARTKTTNFSRTNGTSYANGCSTVNGNGYTNSYYETNGSNYKNVYHHTNGDSTTAIGYDVTKSKKQTRCSVIVGKSFD